MSTKEQRRQWREEYETDEREALRPRPSGTQPIPVAERCPSATGRRHSFGMKGPDGKYRCWYCCKTREQVAGL